MLIPEPPKAGAAADAGAASLRLHPSLRDHLRDALYDLAPEPPPAPPERLQPLVPTLQELDEAATERWEALLLFLVGASGPPPPAEGSECVPHAPPRDCGPNAVARADVASRAQAGCG